VDLAELYREGNQAVADGVVHTGVESIFRAGFKEFSRLSQQSDIEADAASCTPSGGWRMPRKPLSLLWPRGSLRR
jgi:hypothetical protein